MSPAYVEGSDDFFRDQVRISEYQLRAGRGKALRHHHQSRFSIYWPRRKTRNCILVNASLQEHFKVQPSGLIYDPATVNSYITHRSRRWLITCYSVSNPFLRCQRSQC